MFVLSIWYMSFDGRTRMVNYILELVITLNMLLFVPGVSLTYVYKES